MLARVLGHWIPLKQLTPTLYRATGTFTHSELEKPNSDCSANRLYGDRRTPTAGHTVEAVLRTCPPVPPQQQTSDKCNQCLKPCTTPLTRRMSPFPILHYPSILVDEITTLGEINKVYLACARKMKAGTDVRIF